MNSFEQIEIFAIALIIIAQILIFYKTYRNILLYRRIFPETDSFAIIRPVVGSQFYKLHPKQILQALPDLIRIAKSEDTQLKEQNLQGNEDSPDKNVDIDFKTTESTDEVRLDLIVKSHGGNKVTDTILYSLNTYLVRNKGVASDFNLIKDVVERNCDSLEEDINQTISIPLYLGLLGTFLGIIMGLVQISGMDYNSSSAGLGEAISILLKGVQIAMLASFAGLLLTVLNSGVFMKGAKSKHEETKNSFFTFIQIELLPLLNQNINSTLFSLQSNLHKFNDEFKGNVQRLSGVMGKNHEALIAQERILTSLENMDLTEFAKANVIILKELQLTTEKFAHFNQYLQNIGTLMEDSKNFAYKINELINRTDNFTTVSQKVMEVFEENKELQKFLQHHYSSLDQSHQLISSAVDKVSDTLNQSLDKLKDFTQEKISEVQQITLREIDLLQNEYPEKWKKLDQLTHLEELSKNIKDMKYSVASQSGTLNNEVKEINSTMTKMLSVAESQNRKESNSIWTRIKGVFKKKKKVTVDEE
jgi:hypothetical protein